jgi:hypothetical protein
MAFPVIVDSMHKEEAVMAANDRPKKLILGKVLLQGRKDHYGTVVSVFCDSLKSPVATAFTFPNGEFVLSCGKTGPLSMVIEPAAAYSREFAPRRMPVPVNARDTIFLDVIELRNIRNEK